MADEPMHEAVIRLDKTIHRLDATINGLSSRLDETLGRLDSTISGLAKTMELQIDVTRVDLRKIEDIVDTRATQTSVDNLGNELRTQVEAINNKLDKILQFYGTPFTRSSPTSGFFSG
jgi:hypothetical protein